MSQADVRPESAQLRETIVSELERQSWAPIGLMNLAVKDGVVDLWGLRLDERERNAIRIAVEIIPGMKSVRDHLILIEPSSGLVVYSPDDERKRSGRGILGNGTLRWRLPEIRFQETALLSGPFAPAPVQWT